MKIPQSMKMPISSIDHERRLEEFEKFMKLQKKVDELSLVQHILLLVVTDKISAEQCKEIYKMLYAKDQETVVFAKTLIERLMSEINIKKAEGD